MEDQEKSTRTRERVDGGAASGRRIDLSLTQVVAGALATVAGAVLASSLGVYGTIAGGAVVSIGATVGSAVLQHAFRRTGGRFRSLARGGPAAERLPLPSARSRATGSPAAVPAGTGAAGFDPFDPGGEHTRMMAGIAPPPARESVAVYRGRTTWRPRSWKATALTAVLVFGTGMGVLTGVEAAAGKPMAAVVRDQHGSGTTLGDGTAGTARTPAPAPTRHHPTAPAGTPTPPTAPTPTPTDSPSAPSAPSAPSTAAPTPTPTEAPASQPATAPPTSTETSAPTATPTD